MTFQALLLGGAGLGGPSGLLAGVAASMLALTGGLVAACFAKVCNACDWELTALLNPVYDVRRLGVDFVASPRHASS